MTDTSMTSTSSASRPARGSRPTCEPRPAMTPAARSADNRPPRRSRRAGVLQRKLFDGGYAGSPSRWSTAAAVSPPRTSGRSAKKRPATCMPDFGGRRRCHVRAHRPVDARPRVARRSSHGTSRRSSRARRSGASSTPSRRPARTSPASARRGDPRRRSLGPERLEDLEHAVPTTPTTRCAWPAPTGTCPSTAA